MPGACIILNIALDTTRLQQIIYSKFHLRYQMVTWPVMSRDRDSEDHDPDIFGYKYLENG